MPTLLRTLGPKELFTMMQRDRRNPNRIAGSFYDATACTWRATLQVTPLGKQVTVSGPSADAAGRALAEKLALLSYSIEDVPKLARLFPALDAPPAPSGTTINVSGGNVHGLVVGSNVDGAVNGPESRDGGGDRRLAGHSPSSSRQQLERERSERGRLERQLARLLQRLDFERRNSSEVSFLLWKLSSENVELEARRLPRPPTLDRPSPAIASTPRHRSRSQRSRRWPSPTPPRSSSSRSRCARCSRRFCAIARR
jgi:hypothetical protein